VAEPEATAVSRRIGVLAKSDGSGGMTSGRRQPCLLCRRPSVTGEGVSGLESLAVQVEHPGHLGNAFGTSSLAEAEEDAVLSRHLASGTNALRNFARGFVYGRAGLLGREWMERKLMLNDLSAAQRAELLVLMPGDSRTWELSRNEPDVEELYWRDAYPHFKGSLQDVEFAARHLMQFGRAFAAAELVAFHLKDDPAPPSDLITDVLEGMLKQGKPDATFDGLAYWIGELLDTVGDRADIDESRIARIEWNFAKILRHDRHPKVLHCELSRNPDFLSN
jgi:hypothetical protein